MFRLLTHHKLLLLFVILLILLALYFVFLSQNAEQKEQNAGNSTPQVQPIIALETILTTSDVEQALRQAAIDNSNEGLELWRDRIIEVAVEAGFREQELSHLRGQQGIAYLRFRGERLWFEQQVQRAYRRGDDVAPIFAQFPQAKDLFAQTRQLFAQRDQIIASLAETLQQSSQQPLSSQQAKQAALQIWLERNDAS